MAATTAAKLRFALGAAGTAVLAFGVGGLLTSRDISRPVGVAEWLVGGVIAHDAVLAPVVFILCAVAYRLTRSRLRGRMAAALLIGGSLVLLTIPAMLWKGHDANPTILTLDYTRNLVAVLLGIVVVVLLLTLADVLRDRDGSDSDQAEDNDPDEAGPVNS
jgi:hypothetical protein